MVQIQTPFGGGKTHGLVALYHLFRSGEEARGTELYARVLEEAGVERIPEAKVAVFVGTAADPLKGRTPWGSLPSSLGTTASWRSTTRPARPRGRSGYTSSSGRRAARSSF